MSKRNILVTSALIYANGPMHIGHLLEQIQTDIWVRFQRLRGHNCIYVCGDDAHGTPIMINAEKRGISPEELIAESYELHLDDFKKFLVSVDNYYTTHSDENKNLAEFIYKNLDLNGDISTRTIEQAYDPIKNMFLPDRYVKGECPRCGSLDQYSDNCEVCGSTYDPSELKNPKSVISGATPVMKETVHYFFELEHYADMLKNWTQSGSLQKEVKNKLHEWLKSGLKAWDISRDKPYFGFKIPNTDDKYFYVWLDAPVGYMASFEDLCKHRKALSFKDYWNDDEKTELYHFIGKDIIYFHGLFWPAMLKGAGFRTPTAIFTHGFLTVDGKKMSKSRGTFIKAKTYLEHLQPEYLRYYFAAKLSSTSEDIDLNFEDFMLRVNSDLVGKVVNIASRTAGFIYKKFDGMLHEELDEPDLFNSIANMEVEIAAKYEAREFSAAVRKIMEAADKINQYIDEKKPWVLAKDETKKDEVQRICTMGLNLFKQLMVYLKPIIPSLVKEAEEFLKIYYLEWDDVYKPLLNREINKFKPLMQRITTEQLDALKQAALEDVQETASRHATS